jgi:hypothetical protein
VLFTNLFVSTLVYIYYRYTTSTAKATVTHCYNIKYVAGCQQLFCFYTIYSGYRITYEIKILDLNFDPISNFNLDFNQIRGSPVDIETGYGLDGLGSIPGRGKGFISTPQRPDRLWDPASYAVGTEGSFPRVRQLELEAHFSFPSSVAELYFDSPIRLHSVVPN